MRFVLGFAAGFAVFTAAVAAGPITVDPLGVWSVDARALVSRSEHERVFKPHEAALAPREVVFVGSSRVSYTLPAEWPGVAPERVYNLGVGGATVAEVVEHLRFAVHGLHAERVVLGVELRMFDRALPEGMPGFSRARVRLAGRPVVGLGWKLFDTAASWSAVRMALDARQAEPPTQTWVRGTYVDYGRRKGPSPWDRSLFDPRLEYAGVDGLDPELLGDLLDAVRRARDAGAEVTVFVTPASADLMLLIDELGAWDELEQLKRALVTLGPVFDAERPEAWTQERRRFSDTTHLDPDAGRELITRLADPASAGIGAWIDRSTIDASLAQDRRDLDGWRARNPALAEALREAPTDDPVAFTAALTRARKRDRRR
ncbi:MAG: hypothetical protein ABMA64_17505 [Myxococcota bacterium]